MNPESHPVIRVTRPFPFPAERVFDAWLDPVCAAKWLFATTAGETIRAETDPRVGGRYTFTERREGEDVEHTGEYLEIDRPRRLVFTFGVPKYSPDFARVEIDIVPDGAGCVLTLTQHDTPAEWFSQTVYGWTQILQNQAAQLGDAAAAANRKKAEITATGEARLVRLLPGPIERAWEYLTDSEKRGKWFASGPMELRKGGRVELLFRHGNISPNEEPPEKYREVHHPGFTMIGTVTECEPPRLISFTWEGATPEEQSVVSFELTPKGENVELVLTHRELGSDAERTDVSIGWHVHTGILVALLSGATPPPLWAAHARLEAAYGKPPAQG